MPTPSAQPAVSAVSPPNNAGDGGERTKAGQCNVVIEAVNAGQDVFKVEFAEAGIAAMAESANEFANSVGELKIADRELKAMVEEYQRVVYDTASVLRDVAKGAPNVEERLDEIVERELVLVTKVNAYCSRN